ISGDDAEELAKLFNVVPQAAWEEEIEKEWVEEIAPEWHERVEEEIIDGVEESKELTREPISYYVNSNKTHPSPLVDEFFNPCLEIVQTAQGQIREGSTPGKTISKQGKGRYGEEKTSIITGKSWSNRDEIAEAKA